MRNLRCLAFFALLALAASPLNSETVAKMPKPAGYVDDYAGVLSAPAKSEMESLCNELHDKTRAQVFVVTVDSLDGTAIEPFANDLFHTWKIGEKKTDRGVLMLFAIKDHKRRIEIGYGLEGILNDAKVGDIGRTMVPDLKAANYDDALKLGLHSIAQVIAVDSKVELTSLQPKDDSDTSTAPQALAAVPDESSNGPGVWSILLPFGLFFGGSGLTFFLIWRFAQKRFQGSGSDSGSSSWGSSSSDSSSDSSSSSDSFSGGDGGDSGGGGASGDW